MITTGEVAKNISEEELLGRRVEEVSKCWNIILNYTITVIDRTTLRHAPDPISCEFRIGRVPT